MEFVQIPHTDGSIEWKLARFEARDGSKPSGYDSVALGESTTVEEFFHSTHCQELQCAAFNFINALYTPNFEELRQLVVDPGWVPEDPDAWDVSRDDYAGYGITLVDLFDDISDGKEKLTADLHLSMFYDVPGEEGFCAPILKFAYVDNKWKVLEFDFDA